MKTSARLSAVLSAALISFLTSVSSYAASQTWVSRTGSGTACTRAAPCDSIQAAYAATDPGGVISLLDSYSFSSHTINKSITIRAVNADAGITRADQGSTDGILLLIQAGAADVVNLEGLHFGGASGVLLTSGKQLNIINCVIANASRSADSTGIRFAPTSFSKLSVTDTVVTNIGLGTGGGIVVKPLGGSAQVALERVTINGNAFGIAADGTSSTGGINMTIADSVIANNTQDGIIAVTSSGKAPVGIHVKNTRSVNNAFGIRSIGPNATIRAEGSSMIGNGIGLSFSDGGALLTSGNNAVRANAVDGAFSGPVALQ